MKTTKLKVKLTFTEPTLGTASGNPALQEEFIASKAQTQEQRDEEVAAISTEEAVEKASTVFPRDSEGFVHCWDYQLRGFFKEKTLALIELGEITHLSPWTFRHAIDNFLFVNPRRVHFLKDGQKIKEKLETLQRPLRATTMQGDRVALARSEMLPAGVTLEFEVVILQGERTGKTKTKPAGLSKEQVEACLKLGRLSGFSQWRGGGYGRFEFVMEEAA